MKVEKLMEDLFKEYGNKLLGSTATEDIMLFAFKIDNEIKEIRIQTSETNEEVMEKIRILLNEGDSIKKDA